MNLEDQIIEIQTKLSFQDDTIDQLNQVIIEQQKSIDSLQLKLKQLHSLIQENQNSQAPNNPESEIPPHY